MYYYGPLHMDEQRLNEQPEPIYNSSVPIQDVAWKTSRERWMIETGGERWLGRSVLAVWHDDDDDDDDYCSSKEPHQTKIFRAVASSLYTV